MDTAKQLIADQQETLETRLDAARLAQIALGDVGGGGGMADVFDGFSGPLSGEEHHAQRNKALDALAAAFPTAHPSLDRELARVLAIAALRDERLLAGVLEKIDSESHPVDDIYWMIIAARNPSARSQQQRQHIASALLTLDTKIRDRQLQQDRHWEPRLKELYARLTQLDERLPAALAASPEFGGPGSLIFLEEMTAELRQAAVEKIASSADRDGQYPWSAELVFVLADAEKGAYLDMIRDRFDDFRVRDAVLIALARRPQPADRARFVTGLAAANYEVLESCLDALAALPISGDARELAALVQLMDRVGVERTDVRIRDAAARLLARETGHTFGYEFEKLNRQTESIAAWRAWLAEHHPELATAAASEDLLPVDLKEIDWESGDREAGEKLFSERACAQCHQGRGAVGPDLAGVSKRFGREDIITAIVAPSRDVSSRYQTTAIETTTGKTFVGLIIYQSVDGVTLRDGLNQTIRIEADEIQSERAVSVSLMPENLLDGLSPQDLADLYAYLRGL